MCDLREEIAKAMREVRLAQGEPLTEEEREVKRRGRAID